MTSLLLDQPTGTNVDDRFAQIVDELTRRGFLTGALGSAALLGLAGCSSDGSTIDPSPSAPGAVEIVHEFGTTVVPADPGRVVTVGWNDQDFVLALGVVPVATRGGYIDNYNELPWVVQATGGKGVSDSVGVDEINYEAIVAARPDLILAMYEDIDAATYARLAAIAPTVVKEAKYPEDLIPWRDELLVIGKALGKQAEAEALVADVDAKIAAAKQEHPEFSGKVLVVDYGPESGGHWLVPAGDPRRALFDDLGFATQTASQDVSEEQLDLLDKDVLFVNGATEAQMAHSAAFTHLKVVADGRTLYTPFTSHLSSALSLAGPLSLLYALDILVPQLANALNGRPVADLDNA